jgi:hypothetical protein
MTQYLPGLGTGLPQEQGGVLNALSVATITLKLSVLVCTTSFLPITLGLRWPSSDEYLSLTICVDRHQLAGC